MKKPLLKLLRFYGYLLLVAGIIILTGYMQNPTDRNKLGFFGDFIYTLSHPNTIGDYFKEENQYEKIFAIAPKEKRIKRLDKFDNAYTHRDVHHLNDIQPFQTDNGLELLISLRDQNLILRYCPERDSLISYSIGLGQKQHDVDYLNGRVYVFSNNDPSRYSGMDYNTINTQNLINLGSDYKEFYQLEWFKKHKPFTHHQGQQEVLNDSTFMVEETQPGIIYVVEGNKMRTYFYPHPENEKFLSMLGWARFERSKK